MSNQHGNEVQHTSSVVSLWTPHVRGEHIGFVVPVVMEMLNGVHGKFTLHYSLILPPIVRKVR